jgi:hypothetical protein
LLRADFTIIIFSSDSQAKDIYDWRANVERICESIYSGQGYLWPDYLSEIYELKRGGRPEKDIVVKFFEQHPEQNHGLGKVMVKSVVQAVVRKKTIEQAIKECRVAVLKYDPDGKKTDAEEPEREKARAFAMQRSMAEQQRSIAEQHRSEWEYGDLIADLCGDESLSDNLYKQVLTYRDEGLTENDALKKLLLESRDSLRYGFYTWLKMAPDENTAQIVMNGYVRAGYGASRSRSGYSEFEREIFSSKCIEEIRKYDPTGVKNYSHNDSYRAE